MMRAFFSTQASLFFFVILNNVKDPVTISITLDTVKGVFCPSKARYLIIIKTTSNRLENGSVGHNLKRRVPRPYLYGHG